MLLSHLMEHEIKKLLHGKKNFASRPTCISSLSLSLLFSVGLDYHVSFDTEYVKFKVLNTVKCAHWTLSYNWHQPESR